MRMPPRSALLGFALVLLVACTRGDRSAATRVPAVASSPAGTAVAALTLPPGFRAEVYAEGLRSPTALAFGPDARLYLAQLNGGENAGAGQVVRLDRPGAAPAPVLDHLPKPTGLVWSGRDLYIAAGRDVLRARVGTDGKLDTPAKIVPELPFNSRSEGQLDVLADGRLLFEASGDIGDPRSGRLFALNPGAQPEVLATGLKNGYAHAVDPASGRVFTTDIADDTMDGKVPPEEIDVVEAAADYGWPRCYGARIPAADRGGTETICARTRPPLVTFPPHATPTGLTFYGGADFPPVFRNALYVALWNGSPPTVARITLSMRDGHLVGESTSFIGGLKRPIDLLPDPRGGLLVADFEAGTVYRIVAGS